MTVTNPALAGLTSKFAPKSIVLAIPTREPLLLTVKPSTEFVATLTKPEPSPTNDAAVTTPVVLTLPVKAPSKDVEVVTPVITTPSGNDGEDPEVLPLKLVTLKSDIRNLLFEGHQ